MLKDIVEVKAAAGHRLWLRFEDGCEGTVDRSSPDIWPNEAHPLEG